MITWKKAIAAGIALGATALGSLLTAAAADVWHAREDHELRINTLEVKDESSRALLQEVRQDVKELLKRTDR